MSVTRAKFPAHVLYRFALPPSIDVVPNLGHMPGSTFRGVVKNPYGFQFFQSGDSGIAQLPMERIPEHDGRDIERQGLQIRGGVVGADIEA